MSESEDLWSEEDLLDQMELLQSENEQLIKQMQQILSEKQELELTVQIQSKKIAEQAETINSLNERIATMSESDRQMKQVEQQSRQVEEQRRRVKEETLLLEEAKEEVALKDQQAEQKMESAKQLQNQYFADVEKKAERITRVERNRLQEKYSKQYDACRKKYDKYITDHKMMLIVMLVYAAACTVLQFISNDFCRTQIVQLAGMIKTYVLWVAGLAVNGWHQGQIIITNGAGSTYIIIGYITSLLLPVICFAVGYILIAYLIYRFVKFYRAKLLDKKNMRLMITTILITLIPFAVITWLGQYVYAQLGVNLIMLLAIEQIIYAGCCFLRQRKKTAEQDAWQTL